MVVPSGMVSCPAMSSPVCVCVVFVCVVCVCCVYAPGCAGPCLPLIISVAFAPVNFVPNLIVVATVIKRSGLIRLIK